MEETDHDKAIGYYRDGKYDLFLPLAEKLYKENDVSEFLCQALSNVYFVNKEYEKALNVNTACIAYFQDKSNLDNRLKILEKLGSSYDDERGTTLIRLFTMTSENSYIQSYISLKIVSPPSFLTIYELVRKIKPLFFTNIIYMLFTIQPYGFLLYGKKLLAKALDVEKEESVESVEAVDNRVIERSKKSADADEKYVCILYLILPQLFYTPEEIEKDYRRIMTNLEKIQTVSADISKHFILSNFTYYYTYFGYNIRSIHQLFSSFLQKNYTPISSLQTPIKTAPDKRDRIRIGFFSNLIFKNHSVCRDRLGIIKHLCNDPIFDVFLIRYKQIEKDVLHKNIMKDTSFTEVLLESGESTDKDEQTLLGLSLDILVYPEIGMDMNVYLMAHKRIAPIQINTWGHSETSGINTIDYYISSEYFEGENAQEYYSEKLIQMKSLSTYYYNLNILFNEFTVPIDSLKTQYQLFPSFQLYGIFQSTFKYHPTLMAMIRGILEKNQRAFFILLIAQECWKEFMDYAEKMIGQNVHRIKMIDKMGTIPYCNLLRCMDIMIDSYPFGGCNTSLDSFHFNKIVLTLPSEKLNGRFTLGFYKKMKIMEPVCHSVDELVDKAVYYAKNTEARKTVEDMINDRKHLLFKEQESLLEWNNQMRAVVGIQPRKALTRTFLLQNKLEDYSDDIREVLREEHVKYNDLTNLNDTVVCLSNNFTCTNLNEWIEHLNMTNNQPTTNEPLDYITNNIIQRKKLFVITKDDITKYPLKNPLKCNKPVKKIICYFHICQREGWKISFDMFMNALKKYGLYKKTHQIRCGVVNDNGVLIDDARFHDKKISIIYIGKSEEYERPTLLHMRKMSETEDVMYYYLHTKGIQHFGKPYQQNIVDWINLLIYWNIEKWELAVSLLSKYNTYGCNFLENHYSGNVWWAQSCHIKLLPTVIGCGYTDPEVWILTCLDKAYCVYNSGLEGSGHYNTVFPRIKYEKFVPF
jgi:predicted O-linked N-acetylglucosamine transferase (SPINDLY family)